MNLNCILFIFMKTRRPNYNGTRALFAQTEGNWMLCSAMSKSAKTMVCQFFREIFLWNSFTLSLLSNFFKSVWFSLCFFPLIHSGTPPYGQLLYLYGHLVEWDNWGSWTSQYRKSANTAIPQYCKIIRYIPQYFKREALRFSVLRI